MIYVFSLFIHCFIVSVGEILPKNMKSIRKMNRFYHIFTFTYMFRHILSPHSSSATIQWAFYTFFWHSFDYFLYFNIDYETSATFIEWKINQQSNSITKYNTKFQNKCRFECIRSIGFNVIGASKAITFVKRSFIERTRTV